MYPLLLFPIRIYKRKPSGLLNPAPEDVIPGENYGLYVDIGAYGAPLAVKEGKMWDAKKNVRDAEHWSRSVGAYSAPYTDLMCTRNEFREMYDHEMYDRVRERMGAVSAFPEVYDKVKPEKGIVDLSDVVAAEQGEKKKNGSSRKRSKTPTRRRRRSSRRKL